MINVSVVNSSGCLTFRVDLFHEQEQVLEGEEEEAGRERRAHARHHDGRAGTDRRRRRLRERVRDQKGMGQAINLTMTRGNGHTFLYLTPETYAIVLKKSPDQPSPDYPDKKKPPVHHG